VTGYFSASNREKAKNQGNGVKKQTGQPTYPHIEVPLIQGKEWMR
jgi:hypothetical protein